MGAQRKVSRTNTQKKFFIERKGNTSNPAKESSQFRMSLMSNVPSWWGNSKKMPGGYSRESSELWGEIFPGGWIYLLCAPSGCTTAWLSPEALYYSSVNFTCAGLVSSPHWFLCDHLRCTENHTPLGKKRFNRECTVPVTCISKGAFYCMCHRSCWSSTNSINKEDYKNFLCIFEGVLLHTVDFLDTRICQRDST